MEQNKYKSREHVQAHTHTQSHMHMMKKTELQHFTS